MARGFLRCGTARFYSARLRTGVTGNRGACEPVGPRRATRTRSPRTPSAGSTRGRARVRAASATFSSSSVGSVSVTARRAAFGRSAHLDRDRAGPETERLEPARGPPGERVGDLHDRARVAPAVADRGLFLQERGRRGQCDLGLALAAGCRAHVRSQRDRSLRRALRARPRPPGRASRSPPARAPPRRAAAGRGARPASARRTSARTPGARPAGREAWPSRRRCGQRGATRRGRARRRGRAVAAARRGSFPRRAPAAQRARRGGAGRGAARSSARRTPRRRRGARRAGWPRAVPR